MTGRERKHTAYHEAGHVVVADELNVQYGNISIVSDGLRAGFVAVEGDDCFFPNPAMTAAQNEEAFQAWAEEQAVIDYAGHAACVVLLGIGEMTAKSASEHGAGSDFEKASNRLARNRARMKSAKNRAVGIITSRREHVEIIAAGLLKHRALDGQQIQNLIYIGEMQ